MRISAALCLSALTLTSASSALAHIRLDAPAPRHTAQKRGPCGVANDPGRGEVVTVFAPGETITVRWTETINHPGHFRISFDPDGQGAFGDPASFTELYSNEAVLLDGIPDTPRGGASEVQLTLPELTCERCTLQLIQVMTDKAPYGDGNDLYYQCADLALRYPSVEADMAGPQPAPDSPADLPDSAPDDDASGDDAPSDDVPGDDAPVDTPAEGDPHEGHDDHEPAEPSAESGCATTRARPLPSVAVMLLALAMLGRWRCVRCARWGRA